MPLKRAVWRGHRQHYAATDHGGSLRVSGRFHQARDEFPPDQTWPALYLGLDLHVALGEIQRNVGDRRLVSYRFTEIWVQLEAVLDCRNVSLLGLAIEDLLADNKFDLSQRLASAAIALDVEGIVVPSATLLGENLILFPDQIRPGSVVVELRSIDPRLVKEPFLP